MTTLHEREIGEARRVSRRSALAAIGVSFAGARAGCIAATTRSARSTSSTFGDGESQDATPTRTDSDANDAAGQGHGDKTR